MRRWLIPVWLVILCLSNNVEVINGAEKWLDVSPPDEMGNGRQIVLISGDEEYRSEESLPMLAKILAHKHGFRCTVLFALDAQGQIDPMLSSSIAGIEALDEADLIVMLVRWRSWPADQMSFFENAVARGVPLVALRTSTHAFKYPKNDPLSRYNNFGEEFFGENWLSHWGKHKFEATRGIIEPDASQDAILNGVENVFGDSDVYEVALPDDAHVLLRGEVVAGLSPDDAPANYQKKRKTDGVMQGINDPMMPIAWTRLISNSHGTTNRVFCTTMGAATDLVNEDLRRLIVNSVYWGLDLPVPEKADVTIIGSYEPTQYGFQEFIPGKKPEDYR